jgi:hypothetical protein
MALSKIADRVFRIGHLGDFTDLMPAGILSGEEMGLELAGVPHRKRGVQAAIDYLAEAASVKEQEQHQSEKMKPTRPVRSRRQENTGRNGRKCDEDNLEICSSCSRRCHHIAGGGTD